MSRCVVASLAAMQAELAGADEYRVLLLAPTRRDREVTERLLQRASLSCHACTDALALARALALPAGAILLTDAAFTHPGMEALLAALRGQPPWSDIPVVLLSRPDAPSRLAAYVLDVMRNVTLLERPTSSRTVLSSVQAALRARARQYELRDQLSALQESETALRLRERQSRTLTENTPDILSRFDRRLRHVFVNRAAEDLTGKPVAAFLGRTNRELGMPEALCETWETALRAVFTDGKPRRLEFRYCGVSGVRHFDNLLVPEMAEDGSVETALCVAHDVTEAKRAAEALQAESRRKDEFLAMLAHELRNPLAPIRNATEMLARTLPADEPARAKVGIVQRQVTHLARLVDDLLDVSRITEGRIELHRAPIELAAVIEQALESVEPLIRAREHRVTIETGREPLFVLGDHARLVQSVANLLTNAAKYTDPGGEIRLELRPEDRMAAVIVRDNGVGIGPELMPRIFDLFVQGDRSLDRAQGGLGIGLSVVKRLIEMHDGQVSVSSDGPGLGSSFEIRLPRIEPARQAETCGMPGAPEPRRILVVDDQSDAADSLALLLELDGHTTEAVYSARDALNRAATLRPDIILLDIGLPEMNGYEVAGRLRSILEPVMLIALTGYGQAEDVARAHAAGFDAHVIKPVDYDVLSGLISRARP